MNFQLEDGSYADAEGRLAFVSQERFLSNVIEGDCCFICTVARGDVEFNDEHVLPNWVLRRYRIHNETIRLPNARERKYGSYKIPCCKACNSRMGELLEEPVSKITRNFAVAGPPNFGFDVAWEIFRWLALVFVKTHLIDRAWLFRPAEDMCAAREARENWVELHHAYCVARSFAANVAISSSVLGSVFVLHLPEGEWSDSFDYSDVTASQTIMVRLGRIAYLCVLDDSGAVLSRFRDTFPAIRWGPQSDLQVREFFAHVSYANTLIAERPRFHTRYDPGKCEFQMHATHPPRVEFLEGSRAGLGPILYSMLVKPMGLDRLPEDHDVRRAVSRGEWTLLDM